MHDKRENDSSTTVPEDDFWASILNEALSEAENRMDDNVTIPEDNVTVSEDDATVPEPDDATLPEEPSPLSVSVRTGPLVIRRGETLLDTYRVDSDMIGKGGMGAVWKVHHVGWNADLAMKRPKPEAFRTESQKEGFIRECESWINLGLHPNIVSCYYVREIGGVPTIFSEWMENGDLENHIANGTLYAGSDAEVFERLLDIAIQFARGLRYAHENNLVHQDVKPANLLLTNDWEAKVSDFGIAKARSLLTVLESGQTQREYDPNATQMSPSGGKTPAYCSPEQAAGQLLTQRTDIYSWAVSVLEMYLGYKPWARGGQLTGPVAGIACRDYFAMCTEHPITTALQKLLAACLEQNPDERPHDFGKVEAELLNIYKTETGKAYPHPEPKAAPDTADSLNNRALSFLEIGRSKEAVKLWEAALQQNAKHIDSVYNYALLRWRNGEIDDVYAQSALNKCREDPDYERLAAHFALERGEPERVGEGADPEDRHCAGSLPALQHISEPMHGELRFMAISPDESLIFAGYNSAALYSVTEGRLLWSERLPYRDCSLNPCDVDWDRGEFCFPVFGQKKRMEGRREVYDAMHRLAFFDLYSGEALRKIPEKNPPANADRAVSCRYLPDGSLLVTLAQGRGSDYCIERAVRMDTRSGACLREIGTFPQAVDRYRCAAAFLENGDLAVLCPEKEELWVFCCDTDPWETKFRVSIEELKGYSFYPGRSDDPNGFSASVRTERSSG